MIPKWILREWPLHRPDLDDMMLRKVVHLKIPQATPSFHSSSFLPPPWRRAARAHIARTPRSAALDGHRDNNRGDTVSIGDNEGSPLFQYENWRNIYIDLLDSGLKPVTGEEALKMVQQDGAVLVDVRQEKAIWDSLPLGAFRSPDTTTFKHGTVQGAINVPIIRVFESSSLYEKFIKLLASILFIIEPVESNPDFATVALERLPRDRPLILACYRGGILDKEFKASTVSSLLFWTGTKTFMAAHELYKLGFTNLYFLKGGIKQWQADRLPMAP
eukprot:gnl/MRDRNA2_/MRDRNA2_126239_c0_seq1.p1 gnl/MRDRNA2_/MRDRNA2_126239_c0~~gnl/MRDRNA2_/MRDRNA2_126239_c0_seq1.p1  ORF type:complete len:291 (+),score=24.20 gnl/MRDRNA2_/MRDRNA2_126239_c0_seq1:53-874(+)